MVDLDQIDGLNWDDGKARKNVRHGVSMAEAEQVFFNVTLLLLDDASHSQMEPRLHALGKTDTGRTLHITFTLRLTGELIRVSSARYMRRRSEPFMNKQTGGFPKFASEALVLAYRELHDSTEHLDRSKSKKIALPNLKLTTRTISLGLPQHLLDSLKVAANARYIPYQSLIKVWLREKLHS